MDLSTTLLLGFCVYNLVNAGVVARQVLHHTCKVLDDHLARISYLEQRIQELERQ